MFIILGQIKRMLLVNYAVVGVIVAVIVAVLLLLTALGEYI